MEHVSPLSTPALLPSLPQIRRPGLWWGRGNKICQKLRLPVATGSSRVVMETGAQGVLNILSEYDLERGKVGTMPSKRVRQGQEGGAGRHDSLRRLR